MIIIVRKNLKKSQNIQKMDNFTRKDIHNLKLKFWGVTELETNKGNLMPRHHAYAFDYYSRVMQGYPVFIRGPLLEYPLRERTMNPRTNENKRIT